MNKNLFLDALTVCCNNEYIFFLKDQIVNLLDYVDLVA